jgi:hypothetical protein
LFLAICGSFLISYIVLLVIALAHVNILAFFLNLDPNTVGIQTNKQAILNELTSSDKHPVIIMHNKERGKVLPTLASVISGTEHFYGRYALTVLPQALILPTKKTDMILLDNTLIISDIALSELQEISPFVGHFFVKSFFPTRLIKSYPHISTMERAEYLAYRKEDVSRKLVKIDEEISEIEGIVSSLSASLVADEDAVATEERNELLEKYKKYEEFYKAQRRRGESMAENMHHELGLFLPPDSIRIVFLGEDSVQPTVDEYLGAIVHEYLHYATYISEEKVFASAFFEEALTEYFARAAVRDDGNVKTNLAYPLHVAVIEQMMLLIPESEFEEIYFTKDEEGLQRALDRVYGDGFYQNNLVLFDELQYTSDFKQGLQYANEIMKRIGGEPLRESDLVGIN